MSEPSNSLQDFRIYYEYHEDYPDILKMIRRARNAARKRKATRDAKRSEHKLPAKLKLHTKGTGRNHRDKSPAKKAKDQ